MGRIIGIDLGTTHSVMAVWDGREPRILVGRDGARLTPSVVAFTAGAEVLIGQVARRQAVTNPLGTVASVKRFVGRRFDEVGADSGLVSYRVVEGADGEALVEIAEARYTPEEISAHVLRELKLSAEAFLGEAVEGAVITVPAYFNDAQRAATKEAGRQAGLDVRRIINEPTAAALAYGLDKEHEHLVAVYDFGGGTFDISILVVGDDLLEVRATYGDTHLGGDDIDTRVLDWLVERFQQSTGIEVGRDTATVQRLREAAERAKIDLSSSQETEINLPFLVADASGAPVHLREVLTRSVFEDLIDDLVARTLTCCRQALTDAGRQTADIAAVVLVGGSSRIPLVQRRVGEFFGKEPRRTVNPDEVVALGAGVQAGILSGELKGLVLLDVTSLSLGVETHDGRTAVIIPRNTTIPTEATRTFTTASDGQTSVEVHVLQGESDQAHANDTLGCFELDGLQAAPAGTAQIDVTFSIDLNGMVHARASDRSTGRSRKVDVSIRTRAAADAGTAALVRAPAAAGGDGAASTYGLPLAVTDVVREAERTLAQADGSISAEHRKALQQRLDYLESLIAAHAPAHELEDQRRALHEALSLLEAPPATAPGGDPASASRA